MDDWSFNTIAFWRILSKFEAFFYLRPQLIIIASVQCELVTPSSISPVPPASSLSPDTNGGTDLQVLDALGRSDAEGGVERVLGNGRLLENRFSQALAAHRKDFLFASHIQYQLLGF